MQHYLLKYLIVAINILLVVNISPAQINPNDQKKPAEYVNPFIGASTRCKAQFDWGKTFPGAATPFGMVQVSPNTITGGDNGSGYSNVHKTIEGVNRKYA